jgi:DNA segregation ATPase FtsK/SpoIIIE, S-DNA-T family
VTRVVWIRRARPGGGPTLMWPMPIWAAITIWLLRRLYRLAAALVHGWRLSMPALAVWLLWDSYGGRAVVLVVLVLGVAAGAWARLHRRSFARLIGWPLLARVRQLGYRWRWRRAVATSGLTVWSTEHVMLYPQLVTVRTSGVVDVLTVRMITGQVLDDYTSVVDRLAEALHVHQARIRLGSRFGDVELTLYRRDPLTRVIPPWGIAVTPDLAGLPVGISEDGGVYRLRLTGSHVLVVGATGAGKSSLIWSVLHAVAAGIRAGLVAVWMIDPKGGLEFTPGAGLFTRFAYRHPGDAADLLDDALTLAQQRADRLRGTTRSHRPSPDDPVVLVVVDELAALTAYLGDRATRDRIRNTLGLLLTQGRAVGVHVLAAVQDARKDVVSFRALFPTRIGLRLAEAGEVDLVLGHGARDRGALCDRIPHTAPGVGYVLVDGDPTPTRIRISYLTDTDIERLAAEFRPPINGGRR